MENSFEAIFVERKLNLKIICFRAKFSNFNFINFEIHDSIWERRLKRDLKVCFCLKLGITVQRNTNIFISVFPKICFDGKQLYILKESKKITLCLKTNILKNKIKYISR